MEPKGWRDEAQLKAQESGAGRAMSDQRTRKSGGDVKMMAPAGPKGGDKVEPS